tara:strand:- start:313 stop:705 length:393 start_codon:yes stop_codon:yes gene_type:complete
MLYNYCKCCGAKNYYALSPPQFCSSCGAPFGGNSVASAGQIKKIEGTAKQATRVRRRRLHDEPEDHDAEDGLDIDSIPKVNKLKYNTSQGGIGGRVMSLESFLPEVEEENIEKTKTTKPKRKRGRPRKQN